MTSILVFFLIIIMKVWKDEDWHEKAEEEHE